MNAETTPMVELRVNKFSHKDTCVCFVLSQDSIIQRTSSIVLNIPVEYLDGLVYYHVPYAVHSEVELVHNYYISD